MRAHTHTPYTQRHSIDTDRQTYLIHRNTQSYRQTHRYTHTHTHTHTQEIENDRQKERLRETDTKTDSERQRHEMGACFVPVPLRLWRLTEEEPYQLVPVHVGHRGSGKMRHHF